jgi:hypothetical protein
MMRDRDDDRESRRRGRDDDTRSKRRDEDDDDRPRRRSRDDDEEGGSHRKFKYNRNADRAKAIKDRADGNTGGFDNPFKKDIPIFTCSKDGEYVIRVLPATWDDAKAYAYEVFIHYNVGADKGRFLCPRKMWGEECPVCEEYERAKRNNDEEYAKKLRATQRAAVYCVVRGDEEKNGPQLFPMPISLDQEIASRSRDKKTKEVLYIDDPNEGFDVAFERKDTKQGTRYGSVELDRSPSPIIDNPKKQDRWLQFIADNPIPEILVRRDAKYIGKVFAGSVKKDDDEEGDKPRTRFRQDEDEDEPRRGRRRDPDEDEDEKDDDEDEKPRKKRKQEIDDEDADLDEEDRPKKTRKRLDDDDDEPRERKQKRSSRDDDDDEDDEKPRKRSRLNDDDEDEAPRRRASKDPDEDDDEEDPKPLKKRRRDPDEDDD